MSNAQPERPSPPDINTWIGYAWTGCEIDCVLGRQPPWEQAFQKALARPGATIVRAPNDPATRASVREQVVARFAYEFEFRVGFVGLLVRDVVSLGEPYLGWRVSTLAESAQFGESLKGRGPYDLVLAVLDDYMADGLTVNRLASCRSRVSVGGRIAVVTHQHVLHAPSGWHLVDLANETGR